jgi:hypothetical protein
VVAVEPLRLELVCSSFRMIKSWLCIITSALLYAFSFLLPTYCWWFVYLFPALLFWGGVTYSVSFSHGFVWGALSLFVQLSGVVYPLVFFDNVVHITRIFPWIFILLYVAVHTGFWFWVTSTMSAWFNLRGRHMITSLLLWLVTSSLYFYWLDHYCLWIFNRCEGCPLLHPLLPLTKCPGLLYLLPIVGKPLLLFLLFGVAGAFVLLMEKSCKKMLFIVFISIVLWIGSLILFSFQKKEAPPEWVNLVGVVPIMFSSDADNDHISLITGHACSALAQDKAKELIVMPESALGVDSIDDMDEIACSWASQNICWFNARTIYSGN